MEVVLYQLLPSAEVNVAANWTRSYAETQGGDILNCWCESQGYASWTVERFEGLGNWETYSVVNHPEVVSLSAASCLLATLRGCCEAQSVINPKVSMYSLVNVLFWLNPKKSPTGQIKRTIANLKQAHISCAMSLEEDVPLPRLSKKLTMWGFWRQAVELLKAQTHSHMRGRQPAHLWADAKPFQVVFFSQFCS